MLCGSVRASAWVLSRTRTKDSVVTGRDLGRQGARRGLRWISQTRAEPAHGSGELTPFPLVDIGQHGGAEDDRGSRAAALARPGPGGHRGGRRGSSAGAMVTVVPSPVCPGQAFGPPGLPRPEQAAEPGRVILVGGVEGSEAQAWPGQATSGTPQGSGTGSARLGAAQDRGLRVGAGHSGGPRSRRSSDRPGG